MQSNLVISLGMVGALSIVRFRTAVKEPKDLLFLFWSIGIGIILGARNYELALLISLVVTILLFLLELIPEGRPSLLLVINMDREGRGGRAHEHRAEILRRPQSKIPQPHRRGHGSHH